MGVNRPFKPVLEQPGLPGIQGAALHETVEPVHCPAQASRRIGPGLLHQELQFAPFGLAHQPGAHAPQQFVSALEFQLHAGHQADRFGRFGLAPRAAFGPCPQLRHPITLCVGRPVRFRGRPWRPVGSGSGVEPHLLEEAPGRLEIGGVLRPTGRSLGRAGTAMRPGVQPCYLGLRERGVRDCLTRTNARLRIGGAGNAAWPPAVAD